MKETGILMTPANYGKCEEGSKTQTRRILDTQPDTSGAILPFREMAEEPGVWLYNGQTFKCRYGTVGDRLYVKEGLERMSQMVCYRRDHRPVTGRIQGQCFKWEWERDYLSPLHMPKWAARLWLEITEVRVERLHDISVADVEAEGCRGDWVMPGTYSLNGHHARPTVQHFKALWESNKIHKPGSWDLNPWVWVLTFRKVTP